MKKTATSATKKPLKTVRQPPSQLGRLQEKPNADKITVSHVSQRKASTPTHDKPTRSESPNVSHILPTEISSSDANKQAKPTSAPVSRTVTGFSKEKLEEQLDFVYTHFLQTMIRRKLAEAEASEVDDKLTMLQKRIAENQNILEKITTRLKNVNFNKEVEVLHKLRNPNYGQILETLDNACCKEHLEKINKKMEQSQNQLRMKNIEFPEGGGTELLQTIKDTLAACEKLKADNNLEVPKVIAEIKTSNNNTSETLSRCLDTVQEVDGLILDKAVLEICAKDEE